MCTTIVGNCIIYSHNVGTLMANLLLIKIFLNSVILTSNARYANTDIANFYLMTQLKHLENFKVNHHDIHKKVFGEYNFKKR